MDVPAGKRAVAEGWEGLAALDAGKIPHRLERWPVLTTGCIPSAPASSPCRSPSGSSTTAEARSRPGVLVSCPVARPERYRAVHPDTSPVTSRQRTGGDELRTPTVQRALPSTSTVMWAIRHFTQLVTEARASHCSHTMWLWGEGRWWWRSRRQFRRRLRMVPLHRN